jgi:hypothetical protein
MEVIVVFLSKRLLSFLEFALSLLRMCDGLGLKCFVSVVVLFHAVLTLSVILLCRVPVLNLRFVFQICCIFALVLLFFHYHLLSDLKFIIVMYFLGTCFERRVILSSLTLDAFSESW